MKLRPVLDAFARAPATATWPNGFRREAATLRLGGLAGSSGSVLAAWIANTQPHRQVVVVATTPAEAERWLTDLALLTDEPVALYPQREALGEEEPHYEIAGERAETMEALLRGQATDPGDDRARDRRAHAGAGRAGAPPAAARDGRRQRARRAWPRTLEAMGYRRVGTVTEVAEFSVRGGILDVYGFGMAAPARLEWWGDDITLASAGSTSRPSAPLRGAERGHGPADQHPRRWARTATDAASAPGRRATHAARAAARPTPSSSKRPPVPTPTRWSARGARRSITSRSRGGWARTCPGARTSSRQPAAWTRSACAAFPRLAAARRGAPTCSSASSRPEKVDRDLNRLRVAPRRLVRPRSSSATTRASSSGSTSCSTRAAAARPARRSRSARSTAAS